MPEPSPHSRFPDPIARFGDSLAGPGEPEKVYLVYRESQLLGVVEQLEAAQLDRGLANSAVSWHLGCLSDEHLHAEVEAHLVLHEQRESNPAGSHDA